MVVQKREKKGNGKRSPEIHATSLQPYWGKGWTARGNEKKKGTNETRIKQFQRQSLGRGTATRKDSVAKAGLRKREKKRGK